MSCEVLELVLGYPSPTMRLLKLLSSVLVMIAQKCNTSENDANLWVVRFQTGLVKTNPCKCLRKKYGTNSTKPQETEVLLPPWPSSRSYVNCYKTRKFGKYIVPTIPDEARTFGMDPLFRQFGIYSSVGQLYEPVDKDVVSYYKEAVDGQILEEGLRKLDRCHLL